VASVCGRSAGTTRIFSPGQVGRCRDALLGVGIVAPAAGVADGHQADLVAAVGQRHRPQFRGEVGAGQDFLGHAVIAHQVGQVEDLDVGEQPRRPAAGRDVDVDGAVGDARKAFVALGAKLGAHEDLHADRAVRGVLDIVLEHDETVVVLVLLVRVGGGTQHDVLRQRRPAVPARSAASISDLRDFFSMFPPVGSC
jgi:hypothetical protein